MSRMAYQHPGARLCARAKRSLSPAGRWRQGELAASRRGPIATRGVSRRPGDLRVDRRGRGHRRRWRTAGRRGSRGRVKAGAASGRSRRPGEMPSGSGRPLSPSPPGRGTTESTRIRFAKTTPARQGNRQRPARRAVAVLKPLRRLSARRRPFHQSFLADFPGPGRAVREGAILGPPGRRARSPCLRARSARPRIVESSARIPEPWRILGSADNGVRIGRGGWSIRSPLSEIVIPLGFRPGR